MRLICPNCDAQYEVADSAIPEDGRDVQCSSCGQTWFQKSLAVIEREEIEAEKAELEQQTIQTQQVETQTPIKEPDSDALDEPPLEPTDQPVDDEPADQLVENPRAETELAQKKPSEAAMNILREEAELAAQSRQAPPASGLETQPDLGLDTPQTTTAPQNPIVQERRANLQENAPEIPEHRSRRDLLPDIEAINSTLRATSDRNDTANAIGALPLEQRRIRRRGFRLGFGLVLILSALAIVLYAYTPQIVDKFPQIKPFLAQYVERVNELRNWLEFLMEKATDKMTEKQ